MEVVAWSAGFGEWVFWSADFTLAGAVTCVAVGREIAGADGDDGEGIEVMDSVVGADRGDREGIGGMDSVAGADRGDGEGIEGMDSAARLSWIFPSCLNKII